MRRHLRQPFDLVADEEAREIRNRERLQGYYEAQRVRDAETIRRQERIIAAQANRLRAAGVAMAEQRRVIAKLRELTKI